MTRRRGKPPAGRPAPASQSRLAACLLLLGFVAGCARAPAAEDSAPAPVAPLPTAGLAGQRVVVYPLTLLAADEALPWASRLSPRRTALDRADSLLAQALTARAPEVSWVWPWALRSAARRSGGVGTDPDQMATALLRSRGIERLPDPLWSQMRVLTALAGERYALVPASLIFRPSAGGQGRAELTLVLVDVRAGVVGWRTVAHATAADPWEALGRALKALTPGLP